MPCGAHGTPDGRALPGADPANGPFRWASFGRSGPLDAGFPLGATHQVIHQPGFLVCSHRCWFMSARRDLDRRSRARRNASVAERAFRDTFSGRVKDLRTPAIARRIIPKLSLHVRPQCLAAYSRVELGCPGRWPRARYASASPKSGDASDGSRRSPAVCPAAAAIVL